MNHYAYILTFPDGIKYIGARSTKLAPELDTTYLGSGRDLPCDRKDFKPTKEIIGIFKTRDLLMEFEKAFIDEHDCVVSPDWYNLRFSTHDRHGSVPHNKGGTVDRTQAAKTFSRRYKGARTPAMIKAHEETAEKIRGTKNPNKGHKGITNCAFRPWYYVTPEGVRVEVHEVTVSDYAERLGFKKHQIVNRMRSNNAHKPAPTKPMKGWIFGVL
ncbi:hypothetical protein PP758_gp82 [Pseudomonas phage PAP02]|uniref:hypothetical protein n=1 Tax=Pseudomonas phage PAP02 TaxID=2713224 RepID=UPI0023296582|nr:hypothetical protein PP758_gp82 [Pseudomonas phage PAP02]QKE55153.1 hypothetical protein PAP02_082 [Pseudomonas phage PAP02]